MTETVNYCSSITAHVTSYLSVTKFLFVDIRIQNGTLNLNLNIEYWNFPGSLYFTFHTHQYYFYIICTSTSVGFCFVNIQTGLTFLVSGLPGKEVIKQVSYTSINVFSSGNHFMVFTLCKLPVLHFLRGW